MSTPAPLTDLQTRLGYTFREPALLSEALTHPSFLPEHPDVTASNQRLEFLGDSVLNCILSNALYRKFPDDREGVLTRRRAVLAKGAFLCDLARELEIDAAIRLGTSEETSGGRNRDSILEDALESLVGAIYLDSDFVTVQRVVSLWYGPLNERLALTEELENPKGRLQELVQPVHGNNALRYEVLSADGPEHAREYSVAVFLQERQLGTGSGSSKKSAEEMAACAALKSLARPTATL
ncbi:MAG: ribonuclease III [Candidatus Didemnitutus sp.]|nr:ribonuclease III [Candidatus Didemnitutus sp.]